ncbi:uncharacterized protein LOC125523124 [Triticum urartu]|uniref:uncharacterized protein LOC125523124 n=1 Tax=Triticum urartu TaxID=4572 RepID=UPI0020442A55|nr:uncharacterized protein LOC125523124 [Triticum urartu]
MPPSELPWRLPPPPPPHPTATKPTSPPPSAAARCAEDEAHVARRSYCRRRLRAGRVRQDTRRARAFSCGGARPPREWLGELNAPVSLEESSRGFCSGYGLGNQSCRSCLIPRGTCPKSESLMDKVKEAMGRSELARRRLDCLKFPRLPELCSLRYDLAISTRSISCNEEVPDSKTIQEIYNPSKGRYQEFYQ